MGTGKKVSEGKRLKFAYPEFYFKSPEEMARALPEFPESLHNTRVIADMCNLEIPLPGPVLPHCAPAQVPERRVRDSPAPVPEHRPWISLRESRKR